MALNIDTALELSVEIKQTILTRMFLVRKLFYWTSKLSINQNKKLSSATLIFYFDTGAYPRAQQLRPVVMLVLIDLVFQPIGQTVTLTSRHVWLHCHRVNSLWYCAADECVTKSLHQYTDSAWLSESSRSKPDASSGTPSTPFVINDSFLLLAVFRTFPHVIVRPEFQSILCRSKLNCATKSYFAAHPCFLL